MENITAYITDGLSILDKEMESHIDSDDYNEMIIQGLHLSGLIPLSNRLLAMAKEQLLSKRAFILKTKSNDYPPSVLIKIAEGETAELEAQFLKAERTNKMLVHLLDFLRTSISMRKSELEAKLHPA